MWGPGSPVTFRPPTIDRISGQPPIVGKRSAVVADQNAGGQPNEAQAREQGATHAPKDAQQAGQGSRLRSKPTSTAQAIPDDAPQNLSVGAKGEENSVKQSNKRAQSSHRKTVRSKKRRRHSMVASLNRHNRSSRAKRRRNRTTNLRASSVLVRQAWRLRNQAGSRLFVTRTSRLMISAFGVDKLTLQSSLGA